MIFERFGESIREWLAIKEIWAWRGSPRRLVDFLFSGCFDTADSIAIEDKWTQFGKSIPFGNLTDGMAY